MSEFYFVSSRGMPTLCYNNKITKSDEMNNRYEEINSEEQTRIASLLLGLNELYPNAVPALNYENPFQLLVATILSAQCTDKRVNKVTEKLFKKYKGPEDFAVVNQEELEQDIKECGLFRNKSKNIIGTARLLMEKYCGKVPSTLKELVELPGVGRKTGNVVLANAYGKPAFAVDTHVYRLAHRLGLSYKKDVLGVEKDLMKKVPQDLWIKAHHWLIYHGRNVCRARKPMCDMCSLQKWCPEFQDRLND
ncbi:MAG: endonuclease III [Tepidanaerobacteraceae bacterium]|nr:endonuclease III [Tepidanaerobacteraceae bacterium]